MQITPITPISTSEYANRNQAIRNVCYYVERHRGAFVPIVYGKMRDPMPTAWDAMQLAKRLADKIAGSMRDRGINARPVQLYNSPVWR